MFQCRKRQRVAVQISNIGWQTLCCSRQTWYLLPPATKKPSWKYKMTMMMQIQRSCCSWQDRLLLSLHREFTLLEPNGVWWNQLSLKDAKTIRDCKCLCVLAFSTKSMRTPFVEDTSLLPNYINVPSHQFCSLNCNPPNDFDKMLTSYLTIGKSFNMCG